MHLCVLPLLLPLLLGAHARLLLQQECDPKAAAAWDYSTCAAASEPAARTLAP